MRMHKQRFVAIILDEDGKELMGSDGAIWGEYISLENFRRYRLLPLSRLPHVKLNNGGRVNVYIISPTTHAWNLLYSGYTVREDVLQDA